MENKDEWVVVEDNSVGISDTEKILATEPEKTNEPYEANSDFVVVEDNSVTAPTIHKTDKPLIDGLPSSMDEWGNALDAIGYAYNNPVAKNVPDILKPTVSVGEGVRDVVLGTGAGINDTIADIIDFFDGDTNAVAEWLRQGAKELRNKQALKGGASSAVGEELGSMAVTTPIAGKATDLLFGAGSIAKQAINKGLTNKGIRANEIINKSSALEKQRMAQATDKYRNAKSKIDKLKVLNDIVRKDGKTIRTEVGEPSMPITMDAVVESLPNKIGKLVKDNYEKIIQVLPNNFGGTKASANRYLKAVEDVKNMLNVTDTEAQLIVERLANDTNMLQTATNALFKPASKTGSAIGALIGAGNEPNK